MIEENKNRLYKWGGWAMVLLTIFLGVNTLAALKGLSGVNPAYNSISVMGEGEVVAVPDIATFSFSVAADATTVSAAQTAVTTKMDAILTALKDAGVEEKDIKTENYSVYPRYRYTVEPTMPCSPTYCPPSGGGRQVGDGYTASHYVTVKVRNIDNAGIVLGKVGEKGATNISGISFTQDDPEGARDAARADAIRDAREKAKVLSKELDVRLVRVVSYYDNSGGVGNPMPYYADALGGAETKSSIAPTFPVGENKTKVYVTVTYEIR